MTKYKIELLEKFSDWLTSVQSCIAEDYLADDYVSVRTKTNPKFGELLLINWHRRRNAYFKIIEEGKISGLAIASILGKDIYKDTISLLDYLQKSAVAFVKYSDILSKKPSEDELRKTCEDFDKDYLSNLKGINENVAKLVGKILNTRISLFDCYLSGSDPFKQL